jgi:hypothetical protein
MFAGKIDRYEPDGKIGMLWCTLMHNSPTWPIHGHYECRVCGRQHHVPWDDVKSDDISRLRQGNLRPLRPA